MLHSLWTQFKKCPSLKFYHPAGFIEMHDDSIFGFAIEPFTRILSHYDDNGNERETRFYNLDGSLVEVLKYSYDGVGNKTHIYTFLPDNTLTDLEVIFYDPGGRVSERRDLAPDHSVEFIYLYGYNENGEVDQLIIYEGLDRLFLVENYTYEYDAMGNWIKQIKLTAKGRGSMEVRTIEYY